jgi:hypothetical protein
VRVLSLDVIGAARALHTSHDLMFFAMAGTLTLLSISLGLRAFWSAVLSGVAVVLQGPIPLRGGLGHALYGYSYHTFVNLSYRPHVPLAGLLLIGVLGTLAVRAARPGHVATRDTAPVLVALVALLAVTDETSTALIGFALGVAWLVDYRLIAHARLPALLVLVLLGVVFAGTNTLFAASLAAGTPVQSLTLAGVARVPPLFGGDPPFPLSTPDGKIVLFFDFLPMTACAFAITLVAGRLRSRAYAAMAVFVWVLILVAAFLVVRVVINMDDAESQRFFVAPFFAGIVLAVLHLARMARGSFASLLVCLGVAVPAFYSLYWIREQTPTDLDLFRHGRKPIPDRAFDIDCRDVAGAHFGDTIEPAYIDASEFFDVINCRPIYTFGDKLGSWPVRTISVWDSIPQLRGLDANLVGKDADLDAICCNDGTPNDVVCARALTHQESYRPEGRYLRCPLHPADRDVLLGRAAP